MALNQLNRETRFTDTTSTNDHQLVLSQKLLTTVGQLDLRATVGGPETKGIMREQGGDSVLGAAYL